MMGSGVRSRHMGKCKYATCCVRAHCPECGQHRAALTEQGGRRGHRVVGSDGARRPSWAPRGVGSTRRFSHFPVNDTNGEKK